MRRGMVQTIDQYEFIYKAVLEELQQQLGIPDPAAADAASAAPAASS